MKRMASVLVLLALVGVGQAGEKDVAARLKKGGALVGLDFVRVGFGPGSTDLSELCELSHLEDLTRHNHGKIESLTWLYYLDLAGCR
jgi:hypothetical protein